LRQLPVSASRRRPFVSVWGGRKGRRGEVSCSIVARLLWRILANTMLISFTCAGSWHACADYTKRHFDLG